MTESDAIKNYLAKHDLISFAPTAALIDMDGTLYDSMGHHADAWHRLMTEIGVPNDHDEFYMYEGRTGASTINLLFQRTYGHDATPEQIKELYHRKTEYFSAMPPVGVMPGAQSMVSAFLDHGLTTVLVTGSGQNTLLNRLDHDYPGAFPGERRITSRDVTHGKPHPEPFLRAMALVGAMPESSIAVDNAPLGVMSGAASGAFTVGVVTGPVPAQALFDAGADIVYPSMPAFADALPRLLDTFCTSI